jgi:hypothetical protein
MAETPHVVNIEGRRFQIVVTDPVANGTEEYRVVRLEELTGEEPHPVITVLDLPVGRYGSTEQDAIRHGLELIKEILKEEKEDEKS